MADIFLITIIIFSGIILLIVRKKNAWDALFLNSTVGIIALMAIGLFVNDKEVWLRVVSEIGDASLLNRKLVIFNI